MSCDNSYFSNRFSGNNYAIAYIPEFFEHEFKLIQGQFWGRLSKNYEDDFVLRPPMDITSCKKNDQETFEIMYQNFLAQAMERIWEGIADNKDRLLVSKNLCLD